MRNANSTLVILGIVAAAAIILLILNGLKTERPTARDRTASTDFSEEAVESAVLVSESAGTFPGSADQSNFPDTSGLDSQIPSPASDGVQEPGGVDSSPETGIATQTDEPGGDSAAEEDPAAPRLSQRVVEVVTEVQARQLDGQWEEALNEMNALYLAFDELNPFEQATLLNFYTNTLLQLEMYQESISAFSRLLTIPELRPDVNARAILALGQLHNRVGEPDAAVSYYEQWLAFTAGIPETEQQTQRVQQLLAQARVAADNREIDNQEIVN